MNQKRLDLDHDMNGSYVTSRILVLKYMFLFLLGILLHTFSISWMRNDHFNEDKACLLRFTSQRLRSSRFTSEQFTCPSFPSLRFQVAFSSLRFCCRRLTSLSFASPGFSSPFQAKNIVFRLRHFAPSFLLPSQPHSQGFSFPPSGNQRRETLGTMVPPFRFAGHRDLKVFFFN